VLLFGLLQQRLGLSPLMLSVWHDKLGFAEAALRFWIKLKLNIYRIEAT
jgi:hypothetical protein